MIVDFPQSELVDYPRKLRALACSASLTTRRNCLHQCCCQSSSTATPTPPAWSSGARSASAPESPPLPLWIQAAPAPPSDSRNSVFENPERFHWHGRNQRPCNWSLHHGRSDHRASLLLLPNVGLGMETARQEQTVGQNRE